jgi:hypothetical protein
LFPFISSPLTGILAKRFLNYPFLFAARRGASEDICYFPLSLRQTLFLIENP